MLLCFEIKIRKTEIYSYIELIFHNKPISSVQHFDILKSFQKTSIEIHSPSFYSVLDFNPGILNSIKLTIICDCLISISTMNSTNLIADEDYVQSHNR